MSKKSVISRIGGHVRDYLLRRFPLAMHSSSGIEVALRNRNEIRLYEQIFVENLYKLYELEKTFKVVNPVIFDVGANCGFFSIHALDIWPGARVHAFEPQRLVFHEFKKSISLNNLSDQIQCANIAVGKNDGKANFYENRSQISASLVKNKVARRRITNKYFVNVLSLDSYINFNNIVGIDILKVDVEGGELDVLEGARQALNIVSILLIEVHPPFASAAMVEAIVRKYGFSRAREFEGNLNQDIDLVFVK
mgnify:FL=1